LACYLIAFPDASDDCVNCRLILFTHQDEIPTEEGTVNNTSSLCIWTTSVVLPPSAM
jgi:hypothetical protein